MRQLDPAGQDGEHARGAGRAGLPGKRVRSQAREDEPDGQHERGATFHRPSIGATPT